MLGATQVAKAMQEGKKHYLGGEASADRQLAARWGRLLVDCSQVVHGRVAELVVRHTACLQA